MALWEVGSGQEDETYVGEAELERKSLKMSWTPDVVLDLKLLSGGHPGKVVMCRSKTITQSPRPYKYSFDSPALVSKQQTDHSPSQGGVLFFFHLTVVLSSALPVHLLVITDNSAWLP